MYGTLIAPAYARPNPARLEATIPDPLVEPITTLLTNTFQATVATEPANPQPPTPNPQPPAPDPHGRTALGEVVAAGYNRFVAECFRLHDLPPLGGLVVVENVLGVVYEARTEGLGPISVRGEAGDADGAVYRMHPDLERTLKTQFAALVIGHYGGDAALPPTGRRVVYTYPDCPPRLHYRVWAASDAEVCHITAQPTYLRLLLAVPDAPVDEVIIHLLARSYALRGADRTHLLRTTETLGRLLKGQYDRLVAILETVEALIADDTPATPPRGGLGLPPGVGQVRL